MNRLLSIVLMCFVSTSAFSEDTLKKSLELDLTKMIEIIENQFLEGEAFTIFNTFTVIPKLILVEDTISPPNAVLFSIEDEDFKMGIEVNRALLKIQNRHAIQFALAHELGHGFSETLLEDIDCVGVGGQASEVIADLGAAYVLLQFGLSTTEIAHAISNWKESEIFNEEVSGDHPAGAKRAEYIFEALRRLNRGTDFYEIVDHIIRNVLNSQC